MKPAQSAWISELGTDFATPLRQLVYESFRLWRQLLPKKGSGSVSLLTNGRLSSLYFTPLNPQLAVNVKKPVEQRSSIGEWSSMIIEFLSYQ